MSNTEKEIKNDEEFVIGIKWGKPRKGHPEGLVSAHLAFSTKSNHQQ